MKFTRNFDLEIFFTQYEFSVKYNIGGSDLQTMTVSDLLSFCSDEERTRWENLSLGYTETFGSPDLRQAVADTYMDMELENILCCAGAEEGLFAAMNAILDTNDHVMVPYPNYQSAETIPLGICEVTGIPLDPDTNWTMDLDFIKDHIKPNTKLISINFPNNPTGKVLDKETYKDLVELCRYHGIYLFSDEVYRLIERSEEIRLDQAADIYEKAISLNVMSKSYGLAGLRLGWLASRDKGLLEKVDRIKHFLSICNSAPGEFLSFIALNHKEKILERNRALVDENLKCLNEFFQKYSHIFEWIEPDGGCVGYPRYTGKGTVSDFVQELIDQIGVLFLPADVFRSELGTTPSDRFRIGFGRHFLPEAITELDEYLSRRFQ